MEKLEVGVTGAAGYTGSLVTKKLLKKGHDVIPIDNQHKGQITQIEGQKIPKVDIRDKQATKEKLSNTDIIINLAAISGLDDCRDNPEKAFTTNVEGTNNIARICADHSIPLIHSSSMAVIGDPVELPITSSHPVKPINLYGKTKAINESTIRNLARNQFPAHIFLKSNLYGSHYIQDQKISKNTVINHFIEQASEKKPLTVYKPGNQSRDFIHIEDAAEAYIKSVENIMNQDKKEAEKIPIASGNSTSVNKIAKTIQRIFSQEKGYEPEIKKVKNPRENETLIENFEVSTKKAKQEIDFEAKQDIEESINRDVRKI